MFDENIDFDSYIEKFIVKRLEDWAQTLPALLASLRNRQALSADAITNLETFFYNNRDVVLWYHVTGLLRAFNHQDSIDVASLDQAKRSFHEESLQKMREEIEHYSGVLASSNPPPITFLSILEQ